MLRESPLYLTVKSVTSPSNFVGCIGHLIDHRDFDSYMIKLNQWCQAATAAAADAPSASKVSLRVQKGPVLVNDADSSNDGIKWKRANICSVNKDMTECFLIDEGRVVMCSVNQLLFKLPEFYFEYQPQAKQCRLVDAEPNNNDNSSSSSSSSSWSQDAIDFFHQQLQSGELRVANVAQQVVIKNNLSPFGCEYVIELTRNGENVLDLLVKMGYAQMKRIRFIDECPLSIPSASGTASKKKPSTSTRVDENQRKSSPSNETNDVIILEDQAASVCHDVSQMDISTVINRDSKSFLFSSPRTRQSASPSKKTTSNKARSTSTENPKSKKIDYVSLSDDDEGFENVPGLYNCRIDDQESFASRRILKPDDFIYSDETLMTGYKPNVDIDVEQLTKAVKFATVERLKAARGLPTQNYKWDLPNLKDYYTKGRGENPRDVVKKIYYGGNGDYETRKEKSAALVKFYTKDKERNGEIIITTVLSEIATPAGDTDYDQVLDLLKDCNFCSKTLFTRSLKSLLTSEVENAEPELTVNNVNSKRRNLCRLLGNLYNKACYTSSTQQYNYLSYVLNMSAQLVSEWISVFPNKDISTNVYAKRFLSVRDFLDTSLLHFHTFDKLTCQMVLEKAEEHFMDHVIKNELKVYMFQIMSVFSKRFARLFVDKNDLRDEIERGREQAPTRAFTVSRGEQRSTRTSLSSSSGGSGTASGSTLNILSGGAGGGGGGMTQRHNDDFLSRLIQNDYL